MLELIIIIVGVICVIGTCCYCELNHNIYMKHLRDPLLVNEKENNEVVEEIIV